MQQSNQRRKQFRHVLLLLWSPQVPVSIYGLFWNREQILLKCRSADLALNCQANRMKQRSLCSTPCGFKSNRKTTEYNTDMFLYKHWQRNKKVSVVVRLLLFFSAEKLARYYVCGPRDLTGSMTGVLSHWSFGMRVSKAFGHDQLISFNYYYYRADLPKAYSSQRGGRQWRADIY